MKILYITYYKIRCLLPESLKRFLRGLALPFLKVPQPAPKIPQTLIDNCKLVSDRFDLLNYLPKNAVVAEVGALTGHYSSFILERTTPKELHLLDLDFSKLQSSVQQNSVVKCHQGLSADLLATFPDDYFDWIYIDADHTYEGVKADIQAAQAKVKQGGYLIFNDYARIIRIGLGTLGVHQAVTEFMIEQNWPMAFLAFESDALYDVVLKRPLA
jgi:hypothetical protein